MNIYLLEDDIIQQQRLSGMIKDICEIEGITYLNFHATSRPVDVLSSLKNASLHNLYFLDLEIDDEEQKGFAVAKEIRKSDPLGTIVFVTTHSELAMKTFEYHIGAVDFIDKSLGHEAFRQRVQDCLLLASSRAGVALPTDTFRYESGQSNFQVPFRELLYIETTGTPHKLRLVSTTRVMEFYGDLKEIESLDHRLIRTHRAYVVNVKAIQEIDRKEKKVILADGSECLVSRRLLKTLLEKWKE
ncbi:response regulator transcription factor [Rossellomorea marisflavi]|uniref:response regulator transcription factor n=1 Tax=Rossellomorea marisflavi TaxID=189381 RepID=UPI0011E801CD|nr:response regulator transcription factor [Rossellomorea marisflavi]TYO68911.1 response regulator transcription factor [Rossellomorea marisflavi]UKS65965.1 response regulator transcription factor [Rossellomorea marisflavi]